MKKVLAIFLCLVLMLPVSALPVFVASADTEGRIIQESNLKHSVADKKVSADGKVVDKGVSFPQTDLSDYTLDQVALEMDLYLESDLNAFKAGLKAQFELTSSGKKGSNELIFDLTQIDWQVDRWFRVTLPLSTAKENGKFNAASANYMWISVISTNVADENYSFKLANVRLVDLSKGAVGSDPIGDGSFRVGDPRWQLVETQYPTTEAVIAAYNLGDYFAPNTDLDATKPLQLLIDAANKNGGGTIFIPAGTYTFSGTLRLPEGVTIQGDWRAPTAENPQAVGTIFKVYSGKGRENATPFITMLPNTCVEGITFWYPEQDVNDITPYPVTVRMFDPNEWGKDYTHVRNCTFVNSYRAVQQGPGGSGCPNVYNVYGTPLYLGLFMDNIADIGRFDFVNFAPSYWEQSGLPGAPTSDADRATLENYLLSNAAAMLVGRVDWSYWTYANITGYQTGLWFAESPADPGAYSNGHVYGMNFTDCDTAIRIDGISSAGELFANINISGCKTGILINPCSQKDLGNLQMNDITIDADTAILHGGNARLFFNDGVIKRGGVILAGGPATISATTFETAAPQVTAASGASCGILQGNKATASEFTVDNQCMCPLEISEKAVEVERPDRLTPEQAVDNTVHAARNVLYVADLDKTGTKDVTADLQTLLNKAGTEGGGYVLLPGGDYRLDGSVTVPTGVELVGAVDIGRNAYQIGTIFRVYGKQKDATVILKEGSGLRGVIFDYPVQGNTVSTLQEDYPYAVQGQGKDVYLVNVTIRNGFDGVDLMTYRCDNHYVKYLAGFCFHSVLKIGGGAVGGKVINYQMNSSAWWNGNESKYGSWKNCPTDDEKGDAKKDSDGNIIKPENPQAGAHLLRDVYVQSNCAILTVGDVTDEILFDNFSYLGAIGAHYVEENGKGASGWNVGNAYDYSTVGIQVDGIGDMDFVNVQIVSYNHNGIEKTRHQIYLTDQCDDEVNVYNLACWATPNTFLRADGGKLTVYCADFTADTESKSFAEIANNGKICLQNGTITNTNVTNLADGKTAALSVEGYINERTLTGEDTAAWGTNMVRVTRWDVPQNATIDTTQKMYMTEAFTDYVTETSAGGIENALPQRDSSFVASVSNADTNATIVDEDGNGMMRLYHTANASTAYARNMLLNMESGRTNSQYMLETRVNIKSLRNGNSEDNSFSVSLYNRMGNASASPTALARFCPDGVYVNGAKLADYTKGTWYRVQVDVDLTDVANKTYKVRLLDDEYHVIAESDAMAFGADYQGNKNGVGVLEFAARAYSGTAEDTTEVLVDYAFVTRDPAEAEEDVLYGDVNGDGKVDSGDALQLLRYAAEIITKDDLDITAADLNGDGKVDSGDALLSLQYAAEIITKFPVEG